MSANAEPNAGPNVTREEELFWRQQRDALLMQVSAIEKRLRIERFVKCPECRAAKSTTEWRMERQMGERRDGRPPRVSGECQKG
ncbi:MAG: hypothetical protein LC772_06640 [Chloroflexi bacterium]|nr:hypothetical protein [Chloroflexota bacterium]